MFSRQAWYYTVASDVCMMERAGWHRESRAKTSLLPPVPVRGGTKCRIRVLMEMTMDWASSFCSHSNVTARVTFRMSLTSFFPSIRVIFKVSQRHYQINNWKLTYIDPGFHVTEMSWEVKAEVLWQGSMKKFLLFCFIGTQISYCKVNESRDL